MTRRPARKARPIPQPPEFEWRNHPLIVASGSAAATFLLCLAIFTQVVAPTQNAKLEIELLKTIDANQNFAASVASTSKRNSSLSAELSRKANEILALKKRISSLEQELTDTRANNIFSPGNPYPNELGLVRIGMKKAEIAKTYTGLKIESDADDPDQVTVYLANSPFERVTYFLSDKSENPKISHISFDMSAFRSKYADDFLYKKIVETFGAPSEESTSKEFMWPVGNSYSLFAMSKDGYVLMPRGMVPVFWGLR